MSATEILSHFGAKLRDCAVRQAGAGCYSWAALSSNDSKTRYGTSALPLSSLMKDLLRLVLKPEILSLLIEVP